MSSHGPMPSHHTGSPRPGSPRRGDCAETPVRAGSAPPRRGARPSARPRQGQGLGPLGRAATVLALALVLTAASVTTSRADDYDPEESGHPVRVMAYVLHPVGVILDYLIFRPAHWVVSHEPFQTLFGHEPEE